MTHDAAARLFLRRGLKYVRSITSGGIRVNRSGSAARSSALAASLGGALCLLVGCPSTGNGGQDGGSPPAAPTGLQALPTDGGVTLQWAPSSGATSYGVYYASTPPVTTNSTKQSATTTATSVGSLSNGTPYFFAVSAVNSAGESPLSAPTCAVPTAADLTGLTLYDSLCGEVLDGKKWQPPGGVSVGVAGGAAVMSVSMADEAPRAVRNDTYGSFANLNANGQRVTTLQANVTVPAATASLTGGGQIRALIHLLYSPPANRLNFPGGSMDRIVAQVGLINTGTGLMAYRQFLHCDDPSCAARSAGGIAFTDPSGFGAIGGGLQFGSPAAYDTAYTAMVSLDEGTGIFHWSIAGGSFGTGVSGMADPSAYLSTTADWSGIPLAGAGFQVAQIGVLTLDTSADGGGAGQVTAQFRNVQAGFDDGAAAAFDDFSGTAGNSGPTELSLAKWSNGGAQTVGLSGGSLTLQGQLTSAGAAVSLGNVVNIYDPSPYNTVQADVRVASSATTGNGSVNAAVQGRFYNDGSADGGPNSAVGDVIAGVFINPTTNGASYVITRCLDATCSTAVSPLTGTFTGVTVGSGIHTLRTKWDPTLKKFTFGVDGNLLTVDPTTTLPVAGPANAPLKRIFSSMHVGATPGTASVEATVNNVFVGQ